MANKVEVDGIKQLEATLKKINKTATNDIEQALINGALMVERDAKIKVPVDTGRLRQSITHQDHDFGSKNPYVEIGTNVDYAPPVEYGTSKMTAQPFLRPSYNENKQKILKEIAKAMRKGCGL
jgi:HK97 gp10 family phage protein